MHPAYKLVSQEDVDEYEDLVEDVDVVQAIPLEEVDAESKSLHQHNLIYNNDSKI